MLPSKRFLLVGFAVVVLLVGCSSISNGNDAAERKGSDEWLISQATPAAAIEACIARTLNHRPHAQLMKQDATKTSNTSYRVVIRYIDTAVGRISTVDMTATCIMHKRTNDWLFTSAGSQLTSKIAG